MTRPARLKALSLLLILCLLLQYFPALPVVAEETVPSHTALPATEPAQPLTEQCRILDHNDVYTNPVEQPDGHDKANTYQCIMEYYEENAIMAYYNAVRNQPGLAFCQSCKATLSTCAENQYFLGNID